MQAESSKTRVKFKRSNDRYLGGVCGGIAAQFNFQPLLIRILFGLITIITIFLPGLILYVVLWSIMEAPDE